MPQNRIVPIYSLALRQLLSLSDFERMAGTRAPEPKFGLSRMQELLDRAGIQKNATPTIHIAGTKGKGSVAAMVSNILKGSGTKVGLFTSPHLHHFRERIRVDGEPVSEDEFAFALDALWPHIVSMGKESLHGRPTTFEALTAMALRIFQRHVIDIKVIEVGLGGRLDSTNVLYGDIAVITPISLDHTHILGGTLDRIAFEKSGIIKSGSKVILAPQPAQAKEVLEQTAIDRASMLWRVGEEVTSVVTSFDLTGQNLVIQTPRGTYQCTLPLLGSHQQENAATAAAVIDMLDMGITAQTIIEGIGSVKWDGRFQVLSTNPYLIVDGAHNEHSVARLCQTVRDYVPYGKITVLFGCSSDKDLNGMAKHLSELADEIAVCISRHPRSMDFNIVSNGFRELGVPTRLVENVGVGLRSLMDSVSDSDLVLVTGSLFVVAEALESWYGIEPELYPELQLDSRSMYGIAERDSFGKSNG